MLLAISSVLTRIFAGIIDSAAAVAVRENRCSFFVLKSS